MYSAEATIRLAGTIRSSLLDLSHFKVMELGLDDANAAVTHAAGHGGPFKVTVIRP